MPLPVAIFILLLARVQPIVIDNCWPLEKLLPLGGCRPDNLCKREGENSTRKTHPSKSDHFWYDPCFCDPDCRKYGDCCMDADSLSADRDVSYSDELPWKCTGLPGTYEAIYTIASCPLNWPHSQEADLCERRVRDDDQYNYLLDIPVFSNITLKAYANMHCASCHQDTHLTPVNVKFTCPGSLRRCDDLFNVSYYIPRKHKWQIYAKGEFFGQFITFQVEYPDWTRSPDVARACKTVVKTCPESKSEYAQNCSSYSSYVQVEQPYEFPTIYNNIYCALCNEPTVRTLYIKCGEPWGLPSVFHNGICVDIKLPTPAPEAFTTEPLLLFIPDPSDPVVENGPAASRVNCLAGEIFEPLYETCVPFLCESRFSWADGECVRLDTSDSSDFRRSTVLRMLFVVSLLMFLYF